MSKIKEIAKEFRQISNVSTITEERQDWFGQCDDCLDPSPHFVNLIKLVFSYEGQKWIIPFKLCAYPDESALLMAVRMAIRNFLDEKSKEDKSIVLN